ncbi:hypothetical protein ElyMa_005818200 [Elysia marginata]|uniref:Uncharacterized protein n=1 Tax=Elysia marginata TaxID=1093978 RepID=A0AAV4FUK4_9GAST|nr:hypothetical protein ElyMa_005818200 [Elysia marginata]
MMMMMKKKEEKEKKKEEEEEKEDAQEEEEIKKKEEDDYAEEEEPRKDNSLSTSHTMSFDMLYTDTLRFDMSPCCTPRIARLRCRTNNSRSRSRVVEWCTVSPSADTTAGWRVRLLTWARGTSVPACTISGAFTHCSNTHTAAMTHKAAVIFDCTQPSTLKPFCAISEVNSKENFRQGPRNLLLPFF